jgi:choline dehydrogenase-like flavoprotein
MKPTSFGLLPAETEVLVLGADLAGAVAASRLARAGKRVVVLERRTVAEHPGQNGSALEPPPGLFEDPRWPAGLRKTAGRQQGQHSRTASTGGGGAGRRCGWRLRPGGLARGDDRPRRDAGTRLPRGTWRWRRPTGAAVLGVEARSLEPAGSGWLVKLEIPGLGRERFDAPAMFVAARAVVLSGGAWAGELLAAAHQHGLSLSPLLGVSRSAAMGEAAASAAVDHLGRVFQGDGSPQAGLSWWARPARRWRCGHCPGWPARRWPCDPRRRCFRIWGGRGRPLPRRWRSPRRTNRPTPSACASPSACAASSPPR